VTILVIAARLDMLIQIIPQNSRIELTPILKLSETKRDFHGFGIFVSGVSRVLQNLTDERFQITVESLLLNQSLLSGSSTRNIFKPPLRG